MAFDFNNIDDIQDNFNKDNIAYMLLHETCISSVLYKHFNITKLPGFKDSKVIDEIFNCKPYIKEGVGNTMHATFRRNNSILLNSGWYGLSIYTIEDIRYELLGIKPRLQRTQIHKSEIDKLKNQLPKFYEKLAEYIKIHSETLIQTILLSPDNGLAYLVFKQSDLRLSNDGFGMIVLTGYVTYKDCLNKIKLNKADLNFEKFMRKACRQYYVTIPTGVFKHVKIGDKDALQYTAPFEIRYDGRIQLKYNDPFRKGYNQISGRWQQLWHNTPNEDNLIPTYILEHSKYPIKKCYAAGTFWNSPKDIIYYNEYDKDNKIKYATIIFMNKFKYDKDGKIIK